jgi:hypothetical protein
MHTLNCRLAKIKMEKYGKKGTSFCSEPRVIFVNYEICLYKQEAVQRTNFTPGNLGQQL